MKHVEVMNYERTKKNIIEDIDPESFTVQDSDEMYSVDFTVVGVRPLKNVSYEMIENESSIIYQGEEFVIKQCKEYAKGSVCAKEVKAVHIMFTIQDCYQYDTISGTKSINECLTHIFKADSKGFKFEVRNTNGVISRVEHENFGNDNLLKLIEKVMDDYDVALVRNNKTLIFIPNTYFSNQTNNQIRYLYNTDDVSFDIDTYNLKTQIKGFGKKKDDGAWHFEPVTYTSPQISKWGIRIQAPVDDERYTIRSNMLERLKKDLQDYPTVSGSVSMKELDFEVKRGDLVRFIYEPLNINQWIKVVGVTYYPLSNKMPVVELDSNKKTMSSYVASLLRGGN